MAERRTVAQKKEAYEQATGTGTPDYIDDKDKTSIQEVRVQRRLSSGIERYGFFYLEDFKYFLKHQNPMILKDIEKQIKDRFIVEGLGSELSILTL